LLIVDVVFVTFSCRFTKVLLILLVYLICLSVIQNLFVTLSCYQNTWIMLKKAAC